MTQSMVEIWKEQYQQSGRREGLEEGRQEGRLEGEFSLLLRQLTRRFGPLPDADIARMKSAGPDELELWADRVLDAASLEDVFR